MKFQAVFGIKIFLAIVGNPKQWPSWPSGQALLKDEKEREGTKNLVGVWISVLSGVVDFVFGLHPYVNV